MDVRNVADELLKTYVGLLFRPDWDDIGTAVRLDSMVLSISSQVPAIMAEHLEAWSLPGR